MLNVTNILKKYDYAMAEIVELTINEKKHEVSAERAQYTFNLMWWDTLHLGGETYLCHIKKCKQICIKQIIPTGLKSCQEISIEFLIK